MAKIGQEDFSGTGRRKTSVARVRVAYGSGRIRVNGRPLEQYFTTATLRTRALRPLEASELNERVDLRVNVRGGGLAGQAGAVSHGLARALLKVDPTFRPALKQDGLLTRDPRMKERKKYGQPGARKKHQYSKR